MQKTEVTVDVNIPTDSFITLCSKDNFIYYKSGVRIFEYDLNTNTITYKDIPSIPVIGEYKGFESNSKTYMYNEDYIYEFDYSSGQIFSYPSFKFHLAISLVNI